MPTGAVLGIILTKPHGVEAHIKADTVRDRLNRRNSVSKPESHQSRCKTNRIPFQQGIVCSLRATLIEIALHVPVYACLEWDCLILHSRIIIEEGKNRRKLCPSVSNRIPMSALTDGYVLADGKELVL